MPGVDFSRSAFKHGLSEKEILIALNDPQRFYKNGLYYGQVSPDDWIEIKLNELDNDEISVYHAQRVKL